MMGDVESDAVSYLPKFEYSQVRNNRLPDLLGHCSHMSFTGWEVVSVFPTAGSISPFYTAVLKRGVSIQ